MAFTSPGETNRPIQKTMGLIKSLRAWRLRVRKDATPNENNPRICLTLKKRKQLRELHLISPKKLDRLQHIKRAYSPKIQTNHTANGSRAEGRKACGL
jgi:hypothetical protein